jgi:DNA-binding NarL/FixJ family response regulator
VALAIQVVSSHPLLTRAVQKTLSSLPDITPRVLPPALSEADATRGICIPRLLLLDACSLPTDLGRLAARCRGHSPGSKFLALLSPNGSNATEKVRLFYWGIDGFLELHERWQTELPAAVRRISAGQFWVPQEVLAVYIKQVRGLLDERRPSSHSLTAREIQVLQLLMRSLTNKEISAALRIGERTVKFHVSNILSKLHVEDRRGLLPNLRLSLSSSES